jgi:altronate dehydratase small subunit
VRYDAIMIHPSDTVATLLRTVERGEVIRIIQGSEIIDLTAGESIPAGHKIAVTDIDEGTSVIKYGAVIGTTSQGILAGNHVHTQNTESRRGRGDIAPGKDT